MKRERGSTSISAFLDHERETKERECLQSLDRTEVERVFHDLTLCGLARQVSEDRYELIDPKITPDAVMRRLLKSSYDDTKKHVDDFIFFRNVARAVFYCAIALMMVSLALFFGTLVPTIYSQIAGGGFVILFVLSIGIQAWGSRLWEKHGLSFERVRAVRLIESYDRFMNQDSKAEDIARWVSNTLQDVEEPTKWSTLDRERESLSKIGRDIEVRVIPAMTGKNRAKADAGEVLVLLACLFFEGSPESMKRATDLFKDPRLTLPTIELPVSAPRWMHMKQTIRRPGFRSLIAIAVAAGVVSVAVLAGTALTGVKFEPNPMNLVMCLGGFAALAALVRVTLPG